MKTGAKRRMTAIVCFDHTVILVGPGGRKKTRFCDQEELRDYIRKIPDAAVIAHIHPGGVFRDI